MKPFKLLATLLLVLATACASIPAQSKTLIDSEHSPVGIWTPSVGGTATYTAQTGTYTRIGKLVTVFCRLSINTIGTGSTTEITGFPFPVDLDPVAYSTAAVYVHDLTASVVTVTGLLTGSTTMTLYSLTAAGVDMAANAIIGDGTEIYFSASYLTP